VPTGEEHAQDARPVAPDRVDAVLGRQRVGEVPHRVQGGDQVQQHEVPGLRQVQQGDQVGELVPAGDGVLVRDPQGRVADQGVTLAQHPGDAVLQSRAQQLGVDAGDGLGRGVADQALHPGAEFLPVLLQHRVVVGGQMVHIGRSHRVSVPRIPSG
jgi:hypothetical protein